MPLEAFRQVNYHTSSLRKISQMLEIIAEYESLGIQLTTRQVYYRFVTKGWIPNTAKEYKKFAALLTDARYSGLIDWDIIEDRVRLPFSPSQWSSLDSLIDVALRQFRLPRQDGQENHTELWVEKDALASVLAPLADEYHVTLMVNRGYSSASAMYRAARRMKAAGKPTHLFYIGDHDPSGEDMVRDIEDRLVEFQVEDLTVNKIALTMDQVKKYNPPPNPTKMTDSRTPKYESKHGDSCWEVDALPPDVLVSLIRKALESVIDMELMAQVREREKKDVAKFKQKDVDLDRLQVQLAGCLTAAEGGTVDPARKGDYGWSLPYQKILDLQEVRTQLASTVEALRSDLRAARARLAKKGKK